MRLPARHLARTPLGAQTPDLRYARHRSAGHPDSHRLALGAASPRRPRQQKGMMLTSTEPGRRCPVSLLAIAAAVWLLLASAPAVAGTVRFAQPFLMVFGRSEPQVIAFLQNHPRYAAVEAFITERPGQEPLIRAVITLPQRLSDRLRQRSARRVHQRSDEHRPTGVLQANHLSSVPRGCGPRTAGGDLLPIVLE